ncbi:hypothetical protein ACFZ8E_07405 [Methylobacterium sp. HMF5984]|uniref:hypothetical protein n=1 Tax=Methylobacterium sp. HMF5984 TaxID=3367370 RepID=UPI00385246BD
MARTFKILDMGSVAHLLDFDAMKNSYLRGEREIVGEETISLNGVTAQAIFTRPNFPNAEIDMADMRVFCDARDIPIATQSMSNGTWIHTIAIADNEVSGFMGRWL